MRPRFDPRRRCSILTLPTPDHMGFRYTLPPPVAYGMQWDEDYVRQFDHIRGYAVLEDHASELRTFVLCALSTAGQVIVMSAADATAYVERCKAERSWPLNGQGSLVLNAPYLARRKPLSRFFRMAGRVVAKTS